MIAIHGVRRATIVVLALLLALTLAVPLMGAKGNSGNAKAGSQVGDHVRRLTGFRPATGSAVLLL